MAPRDMTPTPMAPQACCGFQQILLICSSNHQLPVRSRLHRRTRQQVRPQRGRRCAPCPPKKIGFILDLDENGQRYDLPNALYIFMFLWLLIGFTGILSIFGFGNMANIAHLTGLISGLIVGLIANFIYRRI